jgi:hypothetical protein
MPVVVAIIACVIVAALAIYQIVLLLGAPLARFAWGGEDHYLQPKWRRFAVLAIVLYVVAIVAALGGAEVIRFGPAIAWSLACYLFAAAFFGAFVLTARSRSAIERHVMLPVNVVLAGLFLIVAIAGRVGA